MSAILSEIFSTKPSLGPRTEVSKLDSSGLLFGAKVDSEYNFGIFKIENDELIGTIGLFRILRGPLQSAIVGYSLDKNNNGKGYATEAVKLIVNYGFTTLKLHRIEAGVMPHNISSIKVLEKAGFEKEGISKKNVKINGRWEDHQTLAIINPEE
ncbi:hypothetical protein CHH83_23805 [Bacillus sp. 7586-K]|nr:hypothetical protein CHH83_23805 [Bacillus sp. 7586-K]